MEIEAVNNFVDIFPKFDTINKYPKYTLGVSDNELEEKIIEKLFEIEGEDKVRISVHAKSYSNVDELYFIIKSKNNPDLQTVCVSDINSAVDLLPYWNSNKYPYGRWTDQRVNNDNNNIIRTVSDYRFHIQEGKILFWEKLYNFPSMQFNKSSGKINERIGAFDLETYGENNGLGISKVYAAGCAMNDGYKAFYYLNENNLNSSEEIICSMFEGIFDHIENNPNDLNNYTFFAHNLGRFDSVFLIKSLVNLGYKIQPRWKDNDIIIVKITKGKFKITLLDSIKLIPSSLAKLLKSFNCEITKGHFPHSFVNEATLNYIGSKPVINHYFENINDDTLKIYNSLPAVINLKDECLTYLRSDVLGLLEAMNKFSRFIFESYGLNITNYKTLPGLSIDIFGCWFYNKDLDIKMVKGPIEEFIRQAYFGGNSNIFVGTQERFVASGYHYDLNSQYPFAMKNAMPTGNPVFTNNTDINYYNIGFVFAHITPPSEDSLKNLFIQKREVDGSVSCPRTTFSEYISTVDLRQGLEYGYKFEIVCGVNFPDSCEANELFGKFVDSLYELKSTAKDSVTRSVSKLILNSVYGKFGQRENENVIAVMEKTKAEALILKNHINYVAEINDNFVLVKYGARINERLRSIYLSEQSEDLISNSFTKARGIPSAVQISAIISSYARASINPFKNLENVKVIASNTDSLILDTKLPENLINNNLGSWKLEHEFIQGIFVRPKLYCYTDINTIELIRKAAGVDANKLKYADYEKLAKGISITTEQKIFSVNWQNLTVEIKNQTIKLQGI
uniref:Probable DNA polymerase n=1 Tax=Coniophora puteana TaxID=80637 RepID=A0A896Z6L8_9AGAM